MKKFFVLLFAALMLVAFAVPAGAFESKFEVVMLYDLSWVDTDEAYQRNTIGRANDSDWTGFQSMIDPLGSVGFVLKDKNMGFTFNMEPRGHHDNDAVGMNQSKVRQMFYWWDVNDWFNLTIGQLASKHSRLGPSDIWAPTAQTSEAESNLAVWGLGFGQVFSQRLPQIQGNFRLHENFLLQIALVDPDNGETAPNSAIAGLNYAFAAFQRAEETTLPRVDVTLQIDYGPFQFSPSILWVEHQWDKDQDFLNSIGNVDDDVTAWNLALPFMFSQAGFTFEIELNWGENWGNSNIFPHGQPSAGWGGMGLPNANTADTTAVYDVNGRLHDTECIGLWAEAKYNIGMFTPGIFWGYSSFENDDLPTPNNQFDNDRNLWVLWCALSLNEHLTAIPFVKWADMGDIDFGDGTTSGDLGSLNVYGLHFMVVF
jgi:hypothetical protein